ncbi:hypothetical protein H0H92_012350 [Tricholoma furcatifolium]|nr:hypothetical protein H0H92_012350 [Tricholoma furcatifolium]
MWFWHGKMYLGAAHGVAGILLMLWSSPFNIVEPYSDEMLSTLDWLITLQDPTGNWPSKAPNDYDNLSVDNELIQWCHGAPVILILLLKVFRERDGIAMGDKLRKRVDDAMRKGAQIVYRHGLLGKGIGICHGVAGSVRYSFKTD